MDFGVVINTSEGSSIDLSQNTTLGNVHSNPAVCISNAERAVRGFLLAIITTASVLGNFVVIYAVLIKKQFRDRKFAFLLLLIFSDFILGIVMMPLYFVNLLFENYFLKTSGHSCLVMAVLFSFVSIFSYLCITTLALERYIMLRYPIKHRRWFTRSMVVGVTLALIFLATTGAIGSPLFYSLPAKYNAKMHICMFDMKGETTPKTLRKLSVQLITLSVIWFVMVYCSLAVVSIIWKRRNSSVRITPAQSSAAESSTSVTNQWQCNQSLKQISREIRSTIRILSVVFVVLGCCLPFTIGYVCDLLGHHWSERSLVSTIFIFLSKSALNPLINAFFHTRLRQYLVNVLCCTIQSQ